MKSKRQLLIEDVAQRVTGGTFDSPLVSAFCVGALWADDHPKAKEVQDAFEVCICGHNRLEHIYHTGACRPGFKCETSCEGFQPAAKDEK